MSTPSYAPFPNGTAFMDWYNRNCDSCKKCPPPDHQGPNEACDIENTIALASCLDGTLLLDGEHTPEQAAALAARLNWDGQTYLTHACPELDPA